MARETKITLDETEYSIPTLSLDQLERIGDLLSPQIKVEGDPVTEMTPQKKGFELFKIMIEDMTPKPEGKIRCTGAEMQDAVGKIMAAAGLQQPQQNPPVPVDQPAQS